MSDDKRMYTVTVSREIAERINIELMAWNTVNASNDVPQWSVSDWFNNAAAHWLRSVFSTDVADKQFPVQTREFDAILAEMAALHRRKSADYGPDPIAETGMEGIIVRMTDKLHRVRRLSSAWADGAAVSDETIQDTLIDLASYAVIAMVLLRGKWGK